MSKLVVANWKMNPHSIGEAVELATNSDVAGLIICPPFIFINSVGDSIKNAVLGSQDVFWETAGAYTGEVSATQLQNLGAKYVIIGHSERRQNLGETDEMIAKKIKAVIDVGLKPILCVGETKSEHDSGQTKAVIERELKTGLSYLIDSEINQLDIVIAYEPIWAIGTGVPDVPADTVEITKFIKKTIHAINSSLNAKIIYGGSVTSINADDFLKNQDIDGALVGGASLKSDEIKKIVAIAKNY
ncbi:MAG: triose-phosphate isomerase [bacterium]|nr:triose-phosphate isomerase [bacterium]